MDLVKQIPFKIPIKEILVAKKLALKAADFCKDFGQTHIICDENTAEFVDLKTTKTILPGTQKAEYEIAKQLSGTPCDLFIAVGSGSINDITKYAAFLAGKPYIVFGTAPSMNGYASTSASLLLDGHKKSFLAKPAQAIYLDLDILEKAPERLRLAGIGDSACRATVEADNLLSHLITGSHFHKDLFEFLKQDEDKIYNNVEALIKTLIFGGGAMLKAVSSEPASQGEHMIAHYMEMMQKDLPQSYHGEQISVTSISMSNLQLSMLQNNVEFTPPQINAEVITQHFDSNNAEKFIAQTKEKYQNLEPIRISKDKFSYLIEDLAKLEENLKSVGTPSSPRDIGWDSNIYSNALEYSKYTRDRFTFLDLA